MVDVYLIGRLPRRSIAQRDTQRTPQRPNDTFHQRNLSERSGTETAAPWVLHVHNAAVARGQAGFADRLNADKHFQTQNRRSSARSFGWLRCRFRSLTPSRHTLSYNDRYPMAVRRWFKRCLSPTLDALHGCSPGSEHVEPV